jgi:drug/metabolite transporter (DMT)-like permease
MPLHLLFPLASSIVFVFGIMFAKQAISGGASPWTNTFLSNAWLAAIWGLSAVVQGEYLPPALWWQAALAGFAFVAGQLLTYLAFQYGDVSVATPIFGVKVVIVALLLSLIAGEAVGTRVWLGAVLAAAGVAVVQAGARSPRKDQLSPGRAAVTVLLALCAAIALSLFDIGLQFWSRTAGAARFLPALFVFTGLFSCGFLPWIDAPPRLARLKVVKPLLVGSVLMALQAMSMSYALGQFGDAARINIVYALRGLWAVALAWLLARAFGGAEARHSVTIMLLRLAGAVLLTLSVIVALSAT